VSLRLFRITSPTIALFLEEGRTVARTLPFGAIIAANEVLGNQLIEVQYEGEKILMFAQDVRARGEEVVADDTQ